METMETLFTETVPAGLYTHSRYVGKHTKGGFGYDTEKGAVQFDTDWKFTKLLRDGNGDILIMSREQATAYAAELSLKLGYEVRLPTEAEADVLTGLRWHRGRYINTYTAADPGILVADGFDHWHKTQAVRLVHNTGTETFIPKKELPSINQTNFMKERFETTTESFSFKERTFTGEYVLPPSFWSFENSDGDSVLRERLWSFSCYSVRVNNPCEYSPFPYSFDSLEKGILYTKEEDATVMSVFHWEENPLEGDLGKEGLLVMHISHSALFPLYAEELNAALGAWAFLQKNEDGQWAIKECGSGLEDGLCVRGEDVFSAINPHWGLQEDQFSTVYTQGPQLHAVKAVEVVLGYLEVPLTPQWHSLCQEAERVEGLGWSNKERILFGIYYQNYWGGFLRDLRQWNMKLGVLSDLLRELDTDAFHKGMVCQALTIKNTQWWGFVEHLAKGLVEQKLEEFQDHVTTDLETDGVVDYEYYCGFLFSNPSYRIQKVFRERICKEVFNQVIKEILKQGEKK